MKRKRSGDDLRRRVLTKGLDQILIEPWMKRSCITTLKPAPSVCTATNAPHLGTDSFPYDNYQPTAACNYKLSAPVQYTEEVLDSGNPSEEAALKKKKSLKRKR